jgi:hypothetical protein
MRITSKNMKKQMNYFGWKSKTKPLVKNETHPSKRLVLVSKTPKRTPFMNTKLYKPSPMKQKNPMFQKNTLHCKKLKPYGDVDMDGSPTK